MALVKGTNCGFVAARPVADPVGTTLGVGTRATSFKDVAPATTVRVIEIGYWNDEVGGTGNQSGEVGIYEDDAGNARPGALIASVNFNSGDGQDWVFSACDIAITEGNTYWIALFVSSVGSDSNFTATVGENTEIRIGQASLPNPWGLSTFSQAWLSSIYAIWDVAAPPPPATQAPGGSKTPHNYNDFPELTNKQIQEFGLESPHKQITEDFRAEVIKVTDGDTIRLRTTFRDFDFPLRFLDIDAPEMNAGGEVTKAWLQNRIEGKMVDIRINKSNRIDKYGRLLGRVIHQGSDVGEEEMLMGLAIPFIRRREGQLPNMDVVLNIKQWF